MSTSTAPSHVYHGGMPNRRRSAEGGAVTGASQGGRPTRQPHVGVRLLYLLPPASRARVTRAQAFWTSCAGMLANNTLPVRLGDLLRALAVSRVSGVSRVETTSASVVERVFDVAGLAALMVAMTPFLPRHATMHAAVGVAAVILLAAVALVVTTLMPREKAHRLLARLAGLVGERRRDRAVRAVGSMGRGTYGLRSPRAAVTVMGLTLGSWLVLGASAGFAVRAFAPDASITAAVVTLVFVNFAMAVPSTAAGLGVFEVAGVSALTAFGFSSPVALSATVAIHALNILPFVPLGLIGLATPRRGGRSAGTVTA